MARKKKVKKYTAEEKFSHILGKVDRGLKNPDSRIAESYEKGAAIPKKSNKKSLY